MDGARHQLARSLPGVALLAALVVSGACSRSEARASADAPIDTLLPAEESLHRFRGSMRAVSSLSPTFRSKEDLVAAFVAGLATNDIWLLGQTLMTREEFAWLYYPENPISRPPYELPAGLAWFELEGNSLAGVRRALATYGGRRIEFRGLACPLPPVVQGSNRLWNACTVSLREEGRDTSIRIFGSVLERDRRYKLLSAANDL